MPKGHSIVILVFRAYSMAYGSAMIPGLSRCSQHYKEALDLLESDTGVWGALRRKRRIPWKGQHLHRSFSTSSNSSSNVAQFSACCSSFFMLRNLMVSISQTSSNFNVRSAWHLLHLSMSRLPPILDLLNTPKTRLQPSKTPPSPPAVGYDLIPQI